MDYSKTKKIIDFIIRILNVISSYFGKKASSDTKTTDIKQDEQTNIDMMKKVNDKIRGIIKE